MSQNTDLPDENPQKPKRNSTGSTGLVPVTGSITEITIPQTSPGQKAKEVEVHHHGHVAEKKKWKEYIFQFVMLILAVFLGSYAETLREDISERHKEKEYIKSMVEDIKKDTAETRARYSFSFEQIQKIDSLQILFSHDLKNNFADVVKCYELSWYLFWYSAAVFNERTISQLIGSGNMRLIKQKGAADSIMEYYNAIKTIEPQKQQYIAYINTTLGAMYKVYDVSYLRQELNKNDSVLHWANENWHDIHLRTTDPGALKELSSTLENTKLVINNYMQQLYSIRQKADNLIHFLKEEYNINEKRK